MSMYGKTHYNIVISLQLKKKSMHNLKKKNMRSALPLPLTAAGALPVHEIVCPLLAGIL